MCLILRYNYPQKFKIPKEEHRDGAEETLLSRHEKFASFYCYGKAGVAGYGWESGWEGKEGEGIMAN